jgi:hypothetical protein
MDRVGRRLRVGVAVMVLGAGISATAATPAFAGVFYGNGRGSELVLCDAVHHTIEVTASTTMTGGKWMDGGTPPAGFWASPGQPTAVRIQYYSYATKAWANSGWHMTYAFPYGAFGEKLGALPAGRTLVYVDFAWWTGSNWVYRSEYAAQYRQGQGTQDSSYTSGTCYI